MQARGPLMVEHRVIEKVIDAMRAQLDVIWIGGTVDRAIIEDSVDFLRIYADRTHHGKEEDIFFRHLGSRPLTLQHRVWLEELMDEHALSRETTKVLADANHRHRDGDASSLAVIRDSLQRLVDLYPAHIAKEDNVYPMIPAGQSVHEMLDTPEPVASGAGQSEGDGATVILHKGKPIDQTKEQHVREPQRV